MLQRENEENLRGGGAASSASAENRAQRLLATLGENSGIEDRLQTHLPRLLERLETLYGDTENFDAWLDLFCSRLLSWHQERSPLLRDLDQARLVKPDWFLGQDMLAYSAYVDRFAGTLRGVESRIPHLKRLGVRYLHLLPFLRARAGESDGGFAVESYEQIEPELGSMADLEYLTQRLRENHISLCSDFVLNHVADTHKWASAARNGDPTYRKYFHIFARKDEAESFEASLAQVFPQTAPKNFTHVPDAGGWVWTTFYPYQWDLNYANPAVFLAMAEALIRLANRGVEVFRLDSTAYLWKRQGSNCMNQPEAHLILQALRAIVDIVAPGVLLKAEAIVPARELSPYFGLPDKPGQECHLAYQSSLMSALWVCLAEQDGSLLRKILRDAPGLPPHTAWLTYVRCHDDIGWNVLRGELGAEGSARLVQVARFYAGETAESYAGGRAFQSSSPDHVHGTNGMSAALTGWSHAPTVAARELATRRLLLLYGVALAAGGIPLIYMGDEFALGNDTRPLSAWPRGADGRQLHRPTLTAEVLTEAEDGESPPGQFFARFQTLLAHRRALPALAATTEMAVAADLPTAVLGIRRGEHLLCLFNFSAASLTLPVSRLELPGESGWLDVLSGESLGETLQLAAYGMVWLNGAVAEQAP